MRQSRIISIKNDFKVSYAQSKYLDIYVHFDADGSNTFQCLDVSGKRLGRTGC